MDTLQIELTGNTPQTLMDHQKHLIEFSGDSRPEDVQKFYGPILKWLEEYKKYIYYLKDTQSSTIKITGNFKFEYFNSSSAKYVMDVILALGDIANGDNIELSLNWYYDSMDEDMKESGEEFEDMLDITFNYFAVD